MDKKLKNKMRIKTEKTPKCKICGLEITGNNYIIFNKDFITHTECNKVVMIKIGKYTIKESYDDRIGNHLWIEKHGGEGMGYNIDSFEKILDEFGKKNFRQKHGYVTYSKKRRRL